MLLSKSMRGDRKGALARVLVRSPAAEALESQIALSVSPVAVTELSAASAGAVGRSASSSLSVNGYVFQTLASFVPFPNGENPDSNLIPDSNGNLFGTTQLGGTLGEGTVFEIVHGTHQINALASFTGPDGNKPVGQLAVDSNGNLFGATREGGASGNGTVFEVVHGTSTITTIASFDHANGAYPEGGVTLDANGNIFGTARFGGTNNDGTVFRITHGTKAITTLGSFDGTHGKYPYATVTLDHSGNLFGTTEFDDVGGSGTVFEVARGTATINTVASFDGTNSGHPRAGIAIDSKGNLFGTTHGVNDSGMVFEIPHGSSFFTTLVQFNNTNGSGPLGLTLDSSGNIFGTTDQGANGASVFEIVHGTQVITTIANISDSAGDLTLDSKGDIFATTFSGGIDKNGLTNDEGSVFEIVHGTKTVTTVAGFDDPNGVNPVASLTLNANGNLFGTTASGGTGNAGLGAGTVFEVLGGTTSIKTLASVTMSESPQGGLTFDSNGNLFGTTFGMNFSGGHNDYGTVFEIVHGTTDITTLTSFNNSNGGHPIGNLAIDNDGDLLGTTTQGGDNNLGTVFEVVHGTSAITTIASFNMSNGADPLAGVTLDSNGNIFGTTSQGGANHAGTVFEIMHGTTTIITLASFSGNGGFGPAASLTLDPSGNIFGTTYYGGINDAGTVFEIAHGSTNVTTLADVNYISGGGPSNVVLDSNGDLFGTTAHGGSNGLGIVFEIVHGATSITPLVTFERTNGAIPSAGLTLDSNGNLFGTTSQGGAGNGGTVFELSPSTLHLSFTVIPTSTTAGSVLGGAGGLRVAVKDAHGNIINSDSSTITMTVNGGTFATGQTSVSVAAANGVATFKNLVIDTAGTYTLGVSDGSLTAGRSPSFVISPAAANKLTFVQMPVGGIAGFAISPAVTVAVEDTFGNRISTDSSVVTLTLQGGTFAGGSATATAAAVNGVATFGNLVIAGPGAYGLQATDGADQAAISTSFTIAAQPGTLVPTIIKSALPAVVIGGQKVNDSKMITVGVTNQNAATVKGMIRVNIYATTMGVVDNSSTLIATAAKKVDLKSGKNAKVHARTKLVSALPAGSYILIAQTLDPAGQSNDATTGLSLTVATPVVTLAATAAVIPAAVSPGKGVALTLNLTNSGNIDSIGPARITVTITNLSTSAITMLLNITRRFKVKAAEGHTLHLRRPVSKAQPPASYSMLVTVRQDGQTVMASTSLTVEGLVPLRMSPFLRTIMW